MMKLRIDPDLPDHFNCLRVVSTRCMISYKFSWSWIWSIIKIDHSSIQKKLLFWSLQFPHRGNQPPEHLIIWKAMERWPGWLWKQGLKSSCGGALQQVVQQQQRNVQKSYKTKLQKSTHPWIKVDKSRFWQNILRILIDLQNTSYPTQPHSVIANCLFRTVYPWWTLFYLLTYHACICFF